MGADCRYSIRYMVGGAEFSLTHLGERMKELSLTQLLAFARALPPDEIIDVNSHNT